MHLNRLRSAWNSWSSENEQRNRKEDMEAVIYTASDLQSSKRRIILDQARSGCAEIRDKDGTGLVLVRKSNFVLLRSVREWFSKFVTVLAAFERPTSERRPTDFGELSWLSEFDEEDRQVFRKELLEALNRSLSLDSFEPVENLIRDWRTTASALSNPEGRRVLTSPGDQLSAFTEVERPEDSPAQALAEGR